jgi:aerobic carbon-monoxide dehydrogenase medium subunit
MKPAAFTYHAPGTVEEALAALAEAPDETSLLAGGQSLVPLLNMRLARPAVIVDLNRVAGLDRFEAANGTVRMGAMLRQRRLEIDPIVREHLPLLSQAAGHIAHVPIRTRGTVGGSLAHADPAAELPAAMTALRARMVVRDASGGSEALGPEAFFRGPLTTGIGPGRMLVAIEVEAPPAGTGSAFLEVARVHGAFALVGAAAVVHTDADKRLDICRLALCGVGGTPYAPSWLESMLIGEHPTARLLSQVGKRVRQSIDPSGDAHADREYRRTIAGTLAAKTLAAAVRRTGVEMAA